jgi:hypothetical protein
MKHTVELHAARMRLQNSAATLKAILRRPARNEVEAGAKASDLKEYWEQLKRDKELVYGPTPQGYTHAARKQPNPLL